MEGEWVRRELGWTVKPGLVCRWCCADAFDGSSVLGDASARVGAGCILQGWELLGLPARHHLQKNRGRARGEKTREGYSGETRPRSTACFPASTWALKQAIEVVPTQPESEKPPLPAEIPKQLSGEKQKRPRKQRRRRRAKDVREKPG